MSNRQSSLSSVALGILLVAASLVGAGPVLAADRGETTVVFLVRHAEKAHDDDHDRGRGPGLTEAGRRRADALARLLRPAGITAIHSTDFRRTRETAAPLARATDLDVDLYDHAALETVAESLRGDPGRHLVVGHSNTTPELVGLLGGEPGPSIDEKSEYDRLYVLVLEPGGRVTTIQQRFGAGPAP